jgi:replication-associated recombination protein RarA
MKNLLLSERWRPKTIEDTILLPRIKKLFENGIQQNVIFYGNFGTGKTTLARILIGKYSKNKPYIELNSSFYTSIDTLRNKIDEFCSKVYMGLDLVDNLPQDTIKYVFLDEFERTSIQYQDALKAYIEEFSRKNVRFILTTNHINKVSPGIRSRMVEVNFDCLNKEEERFLKSEIYKKIINKIAPTENFEISKDNLVKIINKKFPDFRSILIEVDQFRLTGHTTQSNTTSNIKVKQELYDLIYDESKNFEDVYIFLMENFGPEKIDILLDLFGKNFIDYSLNERKENIPKLFQVSYIVCEHQKLLETNTDPIILGMTVIGKIRDLFVRNNI